MGLAVHTAEKSSSSASRAPGSLRTLQPVTTAFFTDQPLRASHQCACGGGCPRCANTASGANAATLRGALEAGVLQRKCGANCDCEACGGIQKKVKIGPAGDAFEQEADSLAERLVTGNAVAVSGHVGPTVHTKRSDHKGAESKGGGESSNIGLSSGHALPFSVQAAFGPRLGHDLSGVRVHHDEAADRAAQSVGARAFTLGRDLVFARGEYAPDTGAGQRLLAHELVHWVQQGGSATRLQRNLKVDATISDSPSTAISQMTPVLQQICPDFDVHPKFGDVTAKAGSNCEKGKFGDVASGSQKLGCCCLCTLARAPNDWKIVVTIKDAPTTDDRIRTVKMIPTSGPGVPDIRYWTGGKPEKMEAMTPSEVLGHELCGHAALMQIKAHPPDEDENTSRTFSDVHDPTVKVENKLAAEMGSRTTPRGLAGSSAHRGESLRVFVVKPFATDDSTISAAAQAVIDNAAKFADVNEQKLIDVVGFSDGSDTAAGISKKRADEVRANFDAKLTKKKDVPFTLSPGAADTNIPRLQPAVDGGVGTVASVEIRLAREPAGLVNLPAGVTLPSTPTHVDPKTPEVVDLVTKKGKSTGNECHDLLIKTAWT